MLYLLQEQNIQVNLKMIKDVEEELKYGQMVQYMKGIFYD